MRQGNHLSQVVSTVSLGLVHFYPIFFFLHVLTHKYSPYALSDLSGALHFYASAVCANNPSSLCHQTAYSPPPWHMCKRPVSETRNPQAEQTTSISIILQSNCPFFSSDILFFIEWHLDMSEAKQIVWNT